MSAPKVVQVETHEVDLSRNGHFVILHNLTEGTRTSIRLESITGWTWGSTRAVHIDVGEATYRVVANELEVNEELGKLLMRWLEGSRRLVNGGPR